MKILLFVVLLINSNILFSQQKSFIREYVYSAGEADSKISSRKIAIEQVKLLLLEELGIYIESYVNYKVEEKDRINSDFFEQEIKTISAGITETKILYENWDGYEYKIRAEIKADPEEVVRHINKTLSARRSSLVIDSLKLLLKSSKNDYKLQSNELDKIKSQLATQNNKISSKQTTLINLNIQLGVAKQKLAKYQTQENKILSDIKKIESRINNATTKAINNVSLGMTPSEVKKVCGNPRSTDNGGGKLFYNYGNVWIMFQSNIVVSVFPSKYFKSPFGYYSEYLKQNIK